MKQCLKHLTLLCLIGLTLSGCMFRTHKNTIEQGNIITADNVARLHTGMSMAEVKAIMGEPMLTNLFTPNRLDYVYTLQKPYQPRVQTTVTCFFANGRLTRVQQSA